MLKYLQGTRIVELCGAEPERCLNALTFSDLPFWELEKLDEFCVRFTIYERDWTCVERTATRKQCQVKLVRKRGLRTTFAGISRRPFLFLGVAAAVLTALWIQNYMWFFQVEGTRDLEPDLILRLLDEEGVSFGAYGVGLNAEEVKNRMMLRIPELRWLAVNRDGGIVHVLVAEREEEAVSDDTQGVWNVVAARDGIITSVHVYNGFAQVKPGDTVSRGQLLVSGFADWETHIQATHAEAEVYAETMRTCEAVTQVQSSVKIYTGRTEVCKTLIFQRNRRKISGNSSIFGDKCDKMIQIQQLTLPGGYVLPIWLETVTYSEYELMPVRLTQDQAERILMREVERENAGRMTAGQIERTSCVWNLSESAWSCKAQLFCNELISRSVPVYLFGEEEENGETH